MKTTPKAPQHRFLDINEEIIRARDAQMHNVKVRKASYYDGIEPAYRELARSYSSPLFMGPPVCDELMDVICHMFTPEEARVARHLRHYGLGSTAKSAARAERISEEEASLILERLAMEKCIILRLDLGIINKRYFLMPFFPGTMENILFRNSHDGLTPWHARFAELFDKLYNTGYMLDYNRTPGPAVRYLPVSQSLEPHACAWPSNNLEELLDPFDTFCVTYCQCRLTMDLKGEGCGKPLETCVMMGYAAKYLIHTGRMRKAEKQEIIDIKREAESNGCVTWMAHTNSVAGSNNSCSCCGCCCYMLRLITQFNMPAMNTPPHFLPEQDKSKCKLCGACALACPTGAITVDRSGQVRAHNGARCIGCGLCLNACSQKAISLKRIPNPLSPARNSLSYLARMLPGVLKNTLHALHTHSAK